MPETTVTKFLKGMFILLIHPFIHHTSISLNIYYVPGMLLGAGNTIDKQKKEFLSPRNSLSSEGHREGIRQPSIRRYCHGRRNRGRHSSELGDMHSFLEEQMDTSKPAESGEN